VGQKKAPRPTLPGFYTPSSASIFGIGGKKVDYKNPKVFSIIDVSS
jgi:hypothetical protein